MSHTHDKTESRALKAPAFLYRLFSPLLFIFWFFHALIHAIKFKEWRYLPQRLGLHAKPTKNSIWLHASSVGEVNLIKPLCEQLIAKNNDLTITTFTATGLQRTNHLFSSQAKVMAIPIDCWPISWFFAQRLKPKYSLIAETELWPETLYQIAKRNKPLIQINARLSNKSLHAPKAIYALLVKTLSYFSLHFTRYDDDVKNFVAMGVNKNKIQVIGNLKYAQSSKAHHHDDLIKQPYLLFASTHDNEELSFSSFLLNKSLDFPLLVIAPRHPKRLDQILKSLLDSSLSKNDIAVRSKNEEIQAHTKLYIADTLGELGALYQHAEIVIMGGSFVDVGGHNVLEPAALGACIITGPSDSNIKQDIAELSNNKAIIQVESILALEKALIDLLSDHNKIKLLANNAEGFMKTQQHVLKNYMDKLKHFTS